MWKNMRIPLVVLCITAASLLAIWQQLSPYGNLLATAAFAIVGCLGVISLWRLGKKESWIVKVLNWIWARRRRVWVALCTAIIVNLGALGLLLSVWHSDTRIRVHVNTEPPVAEDDGNFAIHVDIPGHPEIDVRGARHDVSNLTLPWLKANLNLDITVTHPKYQIWHEVRTVGDARNGIIVSLVAQPILVVMLDQGNACEAAAGSVGTSTLLRAALSPDKPARFPANLEEDWRVTVTDTTGKRVHRSPVITIDKQQKGYQVPLGAEDWQPLGALQADTLRVARGPLVAALRLPPGQAVRPEVENLAIGGPPSGGELEVRQQYVMRFEREWRIPRWVGYQLIPAASRALNRMDQFAADPRIPADQQAQLEDYQGTGYDRGHLVAVSDMRAFGAEAMSEANYLSAIAPMTASLNRGAWARLEQSARDYVARANDSLYIFAGPLFRETAAGSRGNNTGFRTLGNNGVRIPTHFWRLHVRRAGAKVEVLCFLMANDVDVKPEPKEHLETLGNIESWTGLRFFPKMSEAAQPDRKGHPDALW